MPLRFHRLSIKIVGETISAALSCPPLADGKMNRSCIFLGLLFVGILMAAVPANALEGKAPVWRYNAHTAELPFPRSKRADAIWASDACWFDCGSYCAWGLAGCLREDAQGRCLKYTDKCDRYCQRQCRTRGGPLLSIEFPWD